MRTLPLGPSLPLWTAALAACLALAAPASAQVTETPQTMDPGSVLMKMDAISFGLAPDTDAPNQYKATLVGNTLFYAGLTSTVDVEAGFQLFVHDSFTLNHNEQTQSGLGSFTIRPKWMFWSDAASGQSAAVMPYIIVPTNQSITGTKSVQGGVIVPYAVTLGAGATAAAMVELDELRNLADTRYDSHLYASGVVKWSLGETVSAYGEATLQGSTGGSETDLGTLGAGATLSLSKNFEWDFEVSKVLGQGRNAWAEVLRFRWKLL